MGSSQSDSNNEINIQLSDLKGAKSELKENESPINISNNFYNSLDSQKPINTSINKYSKKKTPNKRERLNKSPKITNQ